MKTQRLFLALILIALLGFGLRVVLKSRRTTPSAQGSKHVVIAQVGDFFLYAPLYIALDAGFFKERGLDVSIVTTGGDDKTWAAVISDSAQFGISDPTFTVVSGQRGQPGRVIGSIVNGVPFWGVTWKLNLKPVSSGTDLRHLRVATFPAPSTAFVLQEKMFRDAGIAPSISQGAFGSLLTMLRAGQADVALELEPNVSQAVADGAKVLYSMRDIYGDFAITGLTATPEYINNNPSVVNATACAFQNALDLIHSNEARSLDLLEKRFPSIHRDVASAALRRVIGDGIIPSTLIISETAWRKAVDLRVSVGDLPAPGPFSTFVDNRFAEQASRNCRTK